MNKKFILILNIVILLNVLFISDIRAMSIAKAKVMVEVSPIKSYEEMLAEFLRKAADEKFFNSPFYNAVINGNSSDLRYLLCLREHDPSYLFSRYGDYYNLNIRSSNGSSLLHYAAEGGNVCCIQELLKASVFADFCSNDGCTPLHLAARKGNLDCVRELIDAGANINARDSHILTPLHYAARYEHLESVQWLIENGAYVYTPSEEAQNFFGWLRCVRRSYSFESKIIQPLLNLCLVGAILKNERSSIAKVMKCGAKINYQHLKDGDTPMHVAVKCKNPKIIAYLFQFKPDLTIENKGGDTALQLAVYKQGVPGLLDAFLEGAFICPKKLLFEAISNQDLEGIKRLILQRRTLLHKKNENGNVPLHCAVIQGNQDMVEFLLKDGANPSMTNDDGDSCLHLAARGGNRNILERLLRCGVNPYVANVNGETPIDIAEKQEGSDGISMLKKARLRWLFARVFKVVTSPLRYSGQKVCNILYALKNFVFRPSICSFLEDVRWELKKMKYVFTH